MADGNDFLPPACSRPGGAENVPSQPQAVDVALDLTNSTSPPKSGVSNVARILNILHEQYHHHAIALGHYLSLRTTRTRRP
jgi:hypothetical protein